MDRPLDLVIDHYWGNINGSTFRLSYWSLFHLLAVAYEIYSHINILARDLLSIKIQQDWYLVLKSCDVGWFTIWICNVLIVEIIVGDTSTFRVYWMDHASILIL